MPFDPDDYLKFDPDEYLKDDAPVVEERAHASRLPIGQSIPILGPLAQKAGEYAGAGLATIYPGGKFSDNLKRLQQQNAEDDILFADENPVTATLSSFAGGFALPSAPALNAVKGASIGSRVGNWGANLAARMAEAAGVSATDAELRGGDSESAAVDAAAFTGGLGALGGVAKGAGKYIPRIVFGVKPETAAKYRARAPEINAASEEELIGDVEGAYRKLNDAAEEAGSVRGDARADKVAAERIMQAELQNARPPSEIPGEVSDAMRQLGKETSQGSSQAFDVLNKSDREFDIGPFKGYLTQRMNASKIGAALPDTPEFRTLSKYRDFLDETQLKSMRPEQAKQFIQMLDEDVADTYAKLSAPGSRLNAGDKALISYRKFVDSQLKTIPEYADAMKPVAESSRLLSEARDIFSDEKRTHRLLKNLHAPENAQDRAVLEALGKRYGKDFIGRLGEYEKSQAALKNPAEMSARRAALPESQAFARAEEELGDRKLWLSPVKGLNPQSAVRRAVSEGRPDYKAQERLKYLGELEGQNFLQTADDLGVQRALNQGFTRGSRNTNLGAFSIGGLFGKVLKGDPAASQVGHGIGALAGAAADLVGPQTYKAMLDFSMSPKFPQYREMLQTALRRSPNAFIAETNRIARQDPEFQAYMTGRAEEP